VAKGTTARNIRVPDDIWDAAVSAFPNTRGVDGGVSAELRAFLVFLGEHPEQWRELKAAAAEREVAPWQLVLDAVIAYKP